MRILNNTLKCRGPKLVCFRGQPPNLPWEEVPVGWLSQDRTSVPLHLVYGTLGPLLPRAEHPPPLPSAPLPIVTAVPILTALPAPTAGPSIGPSPAVPRSSPTTTNAMDGASSPHCTMQPPPFFVTHAQPPLTASSLTVGVDQDDTMESASADGSPDGSPAGSPDDSTGAIAEDEVLSWLRVCDVDVPPSLPGHGGDSAMDESFISMDLSEIAETWLGSLPPSPPSPALVDATRDQGGAPRPWAWPKSRRDHSVPFLLGARLVCVLACMLAVSCIYVEYLRVRFEVDPSMHFENVSSVAAFGKLLQPTLSLAGQPFLSVAVARLPWHPLPGAGTPAPAMSLEGRDRLVRIENRYSFAILMIVYYLSEPWLLRAIRRCRPRMEATAEGGEHVAVTHVAIGTSRTSGAADGDLLAIGRLLGFGCLVLAYGARLHYTLTKPAATISQALLEISHPRETASRACFYLLLGCMLAFTSRAFSRCPLLNPSWAGILPLSTIVVFDVAIIAASVLRTGFVTECATLFVTGKASLLLGHRAMRHGWGRPVK